VKPLQFLLSDEKKDTGRLCIVYYETINRNPKIKPNSECRCDERLKTNNEESTRLPDTGVVRGTGTPKDSVIIHIICLL
jgi:hypothetical protein